MRPRGRFLLEPAGTFPVIPMIDVMLNLLIFFMLISRYLPPALEVSLPQAAAAQPVAAGELHIAISRAGALAVDGVPADWPALPGLMLYLLGLTQTWTWLESRWVQWQDMGPPHAWALRLLVISNGSAQSCSAPAAFGRPPQAQQSPETWVLRHFLSAAGGQPG